MLFAVADFFFEQGAAAHFATQAAVDAQDEDEDEQGAEQGGDDVDELVGPDGAAVDDAADPAVLDGVHLFGCEFGEEFVEDADEDRFALGRGHGELVAVGRFAADEEAVEL